MYCNNCGKQIPDNANFCNHCGAKAAPAQYRQSTSAPRSNPVPNSAPRTTQTPPRPAQQSESPKVTAQNSVMAAQANEKKGGLGGIFLVVLVFIVCYCFGRGVVGNSLSSKSSETLPVSDPVINITAPPRVDIVGFPSSEGLFFDDILPDQAEFLVNDQHFYSPGYEAYVTFYEGNSCMLLEYGYDGDVVQELENTLIVPTHQLDYGTIGNMLIEAEALIDELHAAHQSMTGTASVIGNYEYLYVQVRITNLDNSYNIEAALDEEILIAPEGQTPVSMYDCEQMLKQQGFARK